mgnify:CR=1 FL=1
MKDKSESEFEKLLAESNIDLEQVLSEKKDGDIYYKKEYIQTNVSHDDLYDGGGNKVFIHKKDGLQNKVLSQLKSLKYKFNELEILDLHGFTTMEAEIEINSFLEYGFKNNLKYLLIIHGKGLNNKNDVAPIKRLVEKILISSPHVLAACSANKHNGGHGATCLILKK